ncbi:MAG: AbrB/MazE/SpoVT family DNA-binding domain-containing protein [Acidimicrobiia bacterium]
MRITSKGQVTIPIEVRERFGFLPDTEVDFVVEGDTVRIVRSTAVEHGRGARAVRRLTGAATSEWTTDELMALTRGER